jgi:hypothetical protein
MARYTVFVFCTECPDVHRMSTSVVLEQEAIRGGSVGDFYPEGDMPPQVAKLLNVSTRCPRTNRLFVQKDREHIFLVRTGD